MEWVTVAVAGSATICVAGLGLLGVLYGHVLGRVHKLEDKLDEQQIVIDKQRAFNHRLWRYCRHLLDLYYRWRRDGAPDPDSIPDEDGDEHHPTPVRPSPGEAA